MKKKKKNEKTKKKLKYCSVDPTRLLFSNFPGKLNPKKLFPKITRWQHGCHQCSSHQATTRRKTNIDAQRGIIYVLFSCPPIPKQARKIIKRPRQLLYLHHSAVRQDLNALLNHFNFLCILFSFMYLCYNTLSSKPFV